MPLTRELIALRALKEIPDGAVVNLGIGIPGLIAQLLPPERAVVLHSENGIIDFGPEPEPPDPDYVNAGSHFVSPRPGASYVHSADSFGIVRGGRLDVAVLGGMQVAENGDLANWMVGDRGLGGIGGAMDIAANARRLIVLMEHVTRRGERRLVRECTYALTAQRCVDTIITDLALIRVTPTGFILHELAPGVTVDEVQSLTDAPLHLAEHVSVMDF